jgi:hypothetical protein
MHIVILLFAMQTCGIPTLQMQYTLSAIPAEANSVRVEPVDLNCLCNQRCDQYLHHLLLLRASRRGASGSCASNTRGAFHAIRSFLFECRLNGIRGLYLFPREKGTTCVSTSGGMCNGPGLLEVQAFCN